MKQEERMKKKKKKLKRPKPENPGISEERILAMVHEETEKRGKDLSEQDREEIEQALKDNLIEGKTHKEAMGIDDALMNYWYSHAYTLYNAGQYEKAHKIFRALNFLDNQSPKYLMGVAATFQMMKDWEGAIGCYLLLGTADPNSPIPFYHMADCYEKIDKPDIAKGLLLFAAKLCGEDPDYEIFKGRCYALAESLDGESSSEDESEEQVDIFAQLKEEAKKSNEAA